MRERIVCRGADLLPSGRAGHYPRPMFVARRLAAPCAALLILLALATGAATAATAAVPAEPEPSVTQRIFADYVGERVIDGDYSADDLDRALDLARDSGVSFGEFASAVQEKYDRDILGLDVGGPVDASDGGLSLLPVPVSPGERDQPPWPFLALTALGAALVLTGAGSSIYRRARR